MADIQMWHVVGGDELSDALSDGGLREIVPQASGLYIWRRRIIAETRATSSASAFCEWMSEVMSHPTALLGESTLSHCVTVAGLTVGGGSLTDDKLETMERAAAGRPMRDRMANLVCSLGQFLPPLYIGEANNLLERTKNHLRGETNLKPYLDTLDLKWVDVELNYHQLARNVSGSSEAKQIQEMLELVAQRVLSPFGTVRPG